MNTHPTTTNSLSAIETDITTKEEQLHQRLRDHLARHERRQAQEAFDLCLAWNAVREAARKAAQQCLNHPDRNGTPLYVASVWFLQDLVRFLTPRGDEEIAYVTGVRWGHLRVLSRICAVRLEEQSVAYARATAQSCSDALIEVHERGLRLNLVAHSHPGSGAGATHPSSTDINYLGRIQRAGADAIGAIVTRDGHVRFFTVDQPFEVEIQGQGVTHVGEDVCRIALS